VTVALRLSVAQLQALHPANRHVRDKIHQQLQVLRDLGFVEFLPPGYADGTLGT
jgi:hypothetical protein